MNITFFVGNGFDINLGLNTRYSDFYPYFLDNASHDNMIRQWLSADVSLWADLEERLGQKLEKVVESEKEKFYDDKAELDGLLLDYLEKEQNRVITTNKEQEIADEFARSLKTLYDDLPEVGRNSINSTINVYSNGDFYYCFISFNYTNVLDQIINITRKLKSSITTHRIGVNTKIDSLGDVLHIHGTLDEEMILGVNDVDQVNNDFLKTDSEFLDTFIKRRMNDNIGQRKTEYAQKLIEDSHIIGIFGMSIGYSDKMWWEEILNWLKKSDYNKLIIFYKGYEEKLQRKNPAITIRLNNRIKRDILQKGGADIENPDIEKIKERIFISYNTDIFNFKEILFQS